jgi:hypothetical protein
MLLLPTGFSVLHCHWSFTPVLFAVKSTHAISHEFATFYREKRVTGPPSPLVIVLQVKLLCYAWLDETFSSHSLCRIIVLTKLNELFVWLKCLVVFSLKEQQQEDRKSLQVIATKECILRVRNASLLDFLSYKFREPIDPLPILLSLLSYVCQWKISLPKPIKGNLQLAHKLMHKLIFIWSILSTQIEIFYQ